MLLAQAVDLEAKNAKLTIAVHDLERLLDETRRDLTDGQDKSDRTKADLTVLVKELEGMQEGLIAEVDALTRQNKVTN